MRPRCCWSVCGASGSVREAGGAAGVGFSSGAGREARRWWGREWGGSIIALSEENHLFPPGTGIEGSGFTGHGGGRRQRCVFLRDGVTEKVPLFPSLGL